MASSSKVIEMDTHLLDWLPQAYAHCKYGSQDWCESYLNNAVEVIKSQSARIEELESALRPFSNAVFNDNGDVTYDLSQFDTDDLFRAYRALKP